MAKRIYQNKLNEIDLAEFDKKLVEIEQTLLENWQGEHAFSLILPKWQAQQTRYQQHLKTLRKKARHTLDWKFRSLSKVPEEQQMEKIAAIQNIFATIAHDMKKLIRLMLADCYKVLGNPPCHYAILALGSLAREEMTPYSDLEWAILLEKESEEYKTYFRRLTELMYIKVTNLGETVLPSLAIESLNPQYTESTWQFFDDIMPRGFAMDGAMSQACKVPQGKRDRQGNLVFELMGTAEELASYVGQTADDRYWVDIEPHLPLVLATVSLIEGSQDLVDTYRQMVHRNFQEPHELNQQPLHRYSMQKLIGKNLQEAVFSPHSGEAGQVFDAKKNLYRLPNLIIDELALYNGIGAQYNSGFSKLTQLTLLPAEARQRLAYVLSDTMRFRLKTYLHYEKQAEEMNPLLYMFLTEGKSSSHYPIEPEDLACLKYNLQVLMPLYDVMEKFNKDPQNTEQYLREASLYATDQLIQGHIAERLHHYEEARNHFQQAAKDKIRQVGGEHGEGVAEIYDYLGSVYKELGDAKQSLSYSQKALDIRLKLYGNKQHFEVAMAYHNVGLSNVAFGKSQDALIYYKRVLDIILNLPDERNSYALLKCYYSMSEAYHLSGDAQQALIYMQKALELNYKLYGAQSFETAMLIHGQAAVYHTLGDIRRALSYHRDALAILRKLYGEVHPHIATIYIGMGVSYQILGDNEQAFDYFDKALTINRRLYGEQHSDVAIAYNLRVVTYIALGKTQQALEDNQKALRIWQAEYGEQHHRIAQTYMIMGVIYMVLYDFNKSLDYCEKALASMPKQFNEQHFSLAPIHNLKGLALFFLEDNESALSSYREALAIWQRYDDQHPGMGMAYFSMGLAHITLGRTQEALECMQKALAILKPKFGDKQPQVLDINKYISQLTESQQPVAEPSSTWHEQLDLTQFFSSSSPIHEAPPDESMDVVAERLAIFVHLLATDDPIEKVNLLLTFSPQSHLNQNEQMGLNALLLWQFNECRQQFISACQTGESDKVKRFIEFYQKFSEQTIFNEGLLAAVQAGQVTILQMLLDTAQADLNYRDESGWNLLHWAARANQPAVIMYLWQHYPALIEEHTGHGIINGKESILHVAVRYQASAATQAILQLAANRFIDQSDQNGWTPLHWAVWNEDRVTVDLLLPYATLTICNYRGWTALDLARHQSGQGSMWQFFSSSSAASREIAERIDAEANRRRQVVAADLTITSRCTLQ